MVRRRGEKEKKKKGKEAGRPWSTGFLSRALHKKRKKEKNPAPKIFISEEEKRSPLRKISSLLLLAPLHTERQEKGEERGGKRVKNSSSSLPVSPRCRGEKRVKGEKRGGGEGRASSDLSSFLRLRGSDLRDREKKRGGRKKEIRGDLKH